MQLDIRLVIPTDSTCSEPDPMPEKTPTWAVLTPLLRVATRRPLASLVTTDIFGGNKRRSEVLSETGGGREKLGKRLTNTKTNKL